MEGPIQILPGQYLDKETNLFYNYFRDYDPQTGRYVQSDPIGLDGGLNTYLYAAANPLSMIDPRGEAEEHKKGARESTREKHEQGQARKKADQGGESADDRRRAPRKRPPGYKGPWPPPGTSRMCIPLLMYNWLEDMCLEDPTSGACLILPPDPNDPCAGVPYCT